MIQFNIGGQYLELPADFDLQFQKKNILFAFDNIECERSTSFNIPSTPHNDAIFKVAKNYHFQGVGMRQRFTAQLQAGVMVQDGYLYIEQYDYKSEAYKAIFVTGDLLDLKQIQEAGEIGKYLSPHDFILSSKQAVSSNANNWDKAKYHGWEQGEFEPRSDVKPSVKIQYLIDLCCSHFSVVVEQVNQLKYMRIVAGSPEFLDTIPPVETTVTLSSRWRGRTQSPINNASVDDSEYIEMTNTTAVHMHYVEVGEVGYWEEDAAWTVNIFKTKTSELSLNVRIGDDFPNDMYIVKEMPTPETISPSLFVGGYYFDIYGNSYGTSLAGRSVTIPAGEFMIIRRSDYEYVSGGSQLQAGMTFGDGNVHLNYDIHFIFTTEYEEIEDGYLRLADNMPEVTMIDLLKINAALLGRVLYYTTENGFSYDTLNFNQWDVLQLKNVVSVKKMQRGFSNYVQHNIIDFESEEYQIHTGKYDDVKIRDKVIADYQINNYNLKQSNNLLHIPFTEGAPYYYLHIKTDWMEEDKENSTDMIMLADYADEDYASRVQLPKNSYLQQLCTTSTTIELTAKMTLAEYNSIKPKTKLWYDGAEWVWIDAQYEKEQVTLKLAKIQ